MDDKKCINTIIIMHYHVHSKDLPEKILFSDRSFVLTYTFTLDDNRILKSIYTTNGYDITNTNGIFFTYTMDEDEIFRLDNLRALFYVSDIV